MGNRPFKNDSIPDFEDINTILGMTQAMIKAAKDSGEDMPSSVLDMLKDPKLFESRYYLSDPVDALTNILSSTSGDLLMNEEIFKKGSGDSKHQEHLQYLLENYSKDSVDNAELLSAVIRFQHSLSRSKYKDQESKLDSDLYKVTDLVVLYLMGANYSVKFKDTTFQNNFLMTTTRMSNTY